VKDLAVVAVSPCADMPLLGYVNPQVVLLDPGLLTPVGLRVADTVKKAFPKARVIVMDLPPVREDVEEYVNAGVSGFITRDATLDDVVNTIRTAAESACDLPPQKTGPIVSRTARDAVAGGRIVDLPSTLLTPREQEVIDLIAEGLSNDEMSDRLRVATDTVRSHVRNIMEKLMLHTRLQIAAYVHGHRRS
jgi:two-component system, NarL family, nitrate/nitrite response regulator NarL